LGEDPIGELRNRGVLSLPKHRVITYQGTTISIEDDEEYHSYFEQFNDFHPKLMMELAGARDRNRSILDVLLELSPDQPTLYFGSSVEQATAMAVLLRRSGRSSAVITGKTRAATRRFYIEEFRSRRLSFLCNFGVLTTGFDAPQVSVIVVARPTASPVLYEQMIGRGMRGPSFGGTEECLVIDIQDNIQFNGQMAFSRYEEYWTT
jgi:superfamily II DNA or RNA helicase